MTTTKTTKPRVSVKRIFAETVGMNITDASEYQYQPGHTGKLTIFAIDDEYWTVSKTRPTWSDLNWQKHSDQFFAERAGTTIWIAKMNSTAAPWVNPATELVAIRKDVWNSIAFFIEGQANLGTFEAEKPELHRAVCQLARCIESERERLAAAKPSHEQLANSDANDALKSAVEMLERIASGKSYSATEFYERLQTIKTAVRD
jgi:hypothetical protein